ncbi:YcxB family protein [Paenibacillus sp. MMO-177]|uniref:YcxB family protein n=1 Tax=Paenibacillus sp. MMO-177 TaxID=3081289 RepID=UPI00301B27BA
MVPRSGCSADTAVGRDSPDPLERFAAAPKHGIRTAVKTQCIIHPRRIVKDRKLNGEFEYSFNSDNLELTVADGTSKVNWSYFAKVWENEHFYFLFHNKRQYWIVPKESFRDAKQEQLFRQIVQSHHPIATGVIR